MAFGAHSITVRDASRLGRLHGVCLAFEGRRTVVRVFGKYEPDVDGNAVFVIPCGCIYRYRPPERYLAVLAFCGPAQTPVRNTDALEQAQRILGDASVVFLDTETTGIDRRAEIIEIAVITRDHRVLLDTLVCPRFPVPTEVTRLTGIGEGDVIPAPPFDAVHNALVHATEGRRTVGWHVEFDRTIILRECRRRNLPEPRAREWIDAAGIVQRYFHLSEPPSLDVACALLRVFPERRHRAGADARAVLDILRALTGDTG